MTFADLCLFLGVLFAFATLIVKVKPGPKRD